MCNTDNDVCKRKDNEEKLQVNEEGIRWILKFDVTKKFLRHFLDGGNKAKRTFPTYQFNATSS